MKNIPLSSLHLQSMKVLSQLNHVFLVNAQQFILFKAELHEILNYIFLTSTLNEGLEPTKSCF